MEPLYTSASVKNDGTVILKAVNLSDSEKETTVRLYGMEGKKKAGKLIRMSGYQLEDENSFEEPEKVAPQFKLLFI